MSVGGVEKQKKMRTNIDEPKFPERVRMPLNDFYKNSGQWVVCCSCRGIKRRRGERFQEYDNYLGKKCINRFCQGEYIEFEDD